MTVFAYHRGSRLLLHLRGLFGQVVKGSSPHRFREGYCQFFGSVQRFVVAWSGISVGAFIRWR
jgi:hypothetical protein